MIRAVVFDFDGVIANSEPLHFRAYRDVLAERGLSLKERDYYDHYLGYDDVGAFRAIAAAAQVALDERALADLVARKAIRLEELERDATVLFPGARDAVVRMAERFPTAIASGALKPEIVRVLDHERLRDRFPVIVSAEDTPASKPDPAPYVRAVELLGQTVSGLAAGACVAVEDSRWGLQSARAAGLKTIAITHTYPAAELQGVADVVIEHMDALDAALVSRLG